MVAEAKNETAVNPMMQEREDVNTRMKTAIDYLVNNRHCESYAEISRKLFFASGSFHDARKGRRHFPVGAVVLAVKNLGVSMEYLLLGKGKILNQAEADQN